MAQLMSLSREKISTLHSAFAGGAAGAITRAVGQPLDVLKIRFQLQLEPIQDGSKYSSIKQATLSILKEEGIATLWSGHVPAQLLSISYGMLQFSVFEKLIQRLREKDSALFTENRNGLNFCCGGIASIVATVFTYPLDTVRTRLIAEQKLCKAYKGFVHASTTIVKSEGVLALYKGVLPTLAQIAPYAGIQFAVYKWLTEHVFKKISHFQRPHTELSTVEGTVTANLVAGSIAGLTAKTATYPFDLVKKRLQIQGFQEYRKSFGKQIYCTGLISCIKQTITEEGLLALYKGYTPSMLKAALVTALHFAIYDEIKHILQVSR